MRFPKLRRKFIRKTPTDERLRLFVKHFTAGAIAGCVSRSITAPMDRLKTFYQVFTIPTRTHYAFHYGHYFQLEHHVLYQVSTKRQNMMQVFREMIHEGGISSLWRGNFMNCIKTMPKYAIRFAAYDVVKKWMRGPLVDPEKRKKPLSNRERFVAGGIAGMAGQALSFPLEVLKVRLSLRKTGEYRGVYDAIKKIYKTEGLRAFGRGFVPTMVAIVPLAGLELAGYEFLRNLATNYKMKKRGKKKLNNTELFLVSSLSGLNSQTITYPLALIITRMMASTADKHNTKNCRQVIYDVWKYEGPLGFYRGLVPNLLKFVPVVAITFVTYEKVLYWMNVAMT